MREWFLVDGVEGNKVLTVEGGPRQAQGIEDVVD
jgi:hypothetical protein